MNITTTTLAMTSAPASEPRAFPTDVRLERAAAVSPEFARYLYALVGGPWHWTDRLAWTRDQWADDLAVPGTEFCILYGEDEPLGYVHLQPVVAATGTDVEIRYFGLAQPAIGRGLGGRLLEHGIRSAWTLDERFDLPPVSRVWVHTCTLDGPAALANYLARGFVIVGTEESDEPVADEPLGSWRSAGGA